MGWMMALVGATRASSNSSVVPYSALWWEHQHCRRRHRQSEQTANKCPNFLPKTGRKSTKTSPQNFHNDTMNWDGKALQPVSSNSFHTTKFMSKRPTSDDLNGKNPFKRVSQERIWQRHRWENHSNPNSKFSSNHRTEVCVKLKH